LDNQGEEKGAKTLYMMARVPQSQIDLLDSSEDVQKALGVAREADERDVMWKGRLASSKIVIAQAKAHATYWLGLAQYDTGKYDAAVEWLERRTLQGNPDGPWTNGARYNLARAYEALGNIAKARELYLADEASPQRHGNRLRARALEKRAAETGSAKAAAS
jgi:tetratricopeptide (TPR) repeat protein